MEYRSDTSAPLRPILKLHHGRGVILPSWDWELLFCPDVSHCPLVALAHSPSLSITCTRLIPGIFCAQLFPLFISYLLLLPRSERGCWCCFFLPQQPPCLAFCDCQWHCTPEIMTAHRKTMDSARGKCIYIFMTPWMP